MSFMRADRDLLLVDYRGVGLSDPFVGCAQADSIESARACRDAVENSALTFRDFRTANFAADIDDLFEALGFDSVILWGGSYGTRVALTMMRDVPGRISHVVLDGVFPLEVNGFSQGARAPLAALAFAADRCANDVRCRAAFGDLRTKLNQIATTLVPSGQAPSLMQAIARFGQHRAAPLLIDFLARLDPTRLQEAIGRIADISYSDVSGNHESGINRALQGRAESIPMALGIVCSEEAAFIDRQPLDTARHRLGQAVNTIFEDFTGGAPVPPSRAAALCDSLGIGAAPAVEIEPVVSNIPTLIFSGGRDMQTSFQWGELAASRLTTSTHLVFPLSGHIVTAANRCAQRIMAGFVTDPNVVETACLDTLDRTLILQSNDVLAELTRP